MKSLIDVLDASVWKISDGVFALIDALDFIHPIMLLGVFLGLLSAIHWLLPAKVGLTLLVLIGIPLISAMITILYAGLASYAFSRDD